MDDSTKIKDITVNDVTSVLRKVLSIISLLLAIYFSFALVVMAGAAIFELATGQIRMAMGYETEDMIPLYTGFGAAFFLEMGIAYLFYFAYKKLK